MSRAATEQAVLWFLRLQDAREDAALRSRFAAWQQADPAHAAEYDAVCALWDGFDSVEGSRRLAQDLTRFRAGRRRRVIAGALAGLMALAALPLAWQQWRDRPLHTLAFASAKGETREQTLPDGSRIVLGADSAVDVVYTHRTRRARLTRGEALFEVRREGDARTARTFEVATDAAQVRVLGTRFVVATRSDGAAVTVLEGRVRVASPDVAGSLQLDAGDAADVAPGAAPRQVDRTAAEAFDFLDGHIVFRGASLHEVAQTLSRYRAMPVRASSNDPLPRIDAVVQPDAVDDFLRLLPEVARVQVNEHDGVTYLAPR